MNYLHGGFIRKIAIIMKSIALLTLLFAAQASGSVKAQKISISFEDAPLEQVMTAIKRQSGYNFFLNGELLKNAENISVTLNNTDLDETLRKVLDGQPISYEINGKTIILHPEIAATAKARQQLSVEGTVTDSTGASLPGVSILVKGTQTGTASDMDGHYALQQVPEDAVLVFSFIGFRTLEIPLNGRSRLDVVLQQDVAGLDEVIVVGYGTQKKSDVTGSVSRIKMEETASQPNHNFLQSLQGRVSGLNVTSPDRPGEVPGLSVRGTNSISANNSPLIVVDGIIYHGNLSDFNANDIETVDILKDASAAAVYGSRAANGVLLITTKTGTTEKPQFHFTTYQGFQQADKLIDVLDGPGYIQKVLDFREAANLEADPEKIDDYLTVEEAENRRNGQTVDWMDHVIRTGRIQNYHLDVSGRSERSNYYVSGTWFKNEGIVLDDDYERISLNLNLNNRITDWYSIGVKSLFSSQNRSGRQASLTQAYRQSPYGSFYDEGGPGGIMLNPMGDPLGYHPFATTLIDNKDVRTSLWGLITSNLDVPFIPGLKWTLNASANLREENINEFFDNVSSSQGQVENGIGTKEVSKAIDWTVDNILNYRTTLNQVHSLDATFLFSREHSQADASNLRGNNFFTQQLGYNNLGLAEIQQIGSNYEDQNSIALMGRLNYAYDERYAITLTVRRDGYSGFSKNHKYATFPSAAFAWTASNEAFMENISWLNHLKLRLSYGKNGNQAIGRYQSLARIGADNYVFDQKSVAAIQVNSMANNELTWETTTAQNIGLDFSVLNGRLNGSADVYSSSTVDLLLKRALPESSGYGEIFTNVGMVHNHGVELTLNSVNLQKDHLHWSSDFVFTLNRNRIEELTGQDANGDGIEDDDIGNRWFIGESLHSIFGYQTNGIYQLDEENIPAGFQPGDFRIVDTDGDGEITPEDRTILGNTLPRYTFSIANTLNYKGFSLYIMINSVQGGKGYYQGNNAATRNVNNPFTTFSERFNLPNVPYWTPDRPSNEYPRINYIPSLPHQILEDRSFVRIQDVSLSYTVNQDVLEKIRMNGLRIYLSAKNLHTFTKWTGYDPENATTLADLPFLRTYTLGVDLKF